MFGRGMYFAESATKADEYTTRGDDGQHCLLVCRVLLGKLKHVDNRNPWSITSELEQSCHASTGSHDAVLGDRERCVGTYREFVTYGADAIYPAYIVWYNRC